MAENDLKLTPEVPSGERLERLSLIVGALRDQVGMECSGIELRPQPPRAIPMTMSADGISLLVGLRFETAAEAEDCARGLAAFCDRDGERLLLKKAVAINRDELGNCSGLD